MSFILLSSILRSPWYIDQDFVTAHAPLLINLLTHGPDQYATVHPEEKYRLPYAVSSTENPDAGDLKSGFDYNSVPAGSSAVIPIKGVLMKEDQEGMCGYFEAGMNTLSDRIRQADAHKNIASIVLVFDSPGGTVDGTLQLADAVKACTKPVVAFIDGMCASAAYFIASSADKIIAQNPLALIGSIGTMISFADERPMLEAKGMKFHNIVSDLSEDKNSAMLAALDGNYKPIKNELLNPMAKIFQEYVTSNRTQLKSDTLTGKVYLAGEALSKGLIDEIGSLSSAIESSITLAVTTSDKPIPKSSAKMKNLPFLIALLSVESLESSDEGVFLNEDQLNAIESALSTLAQTKIELTEASNSLATAHTDLQTALNLSASQAQLIADLQAAPGASTAAANAASDASAETQNDLISACSSLSTSEAIDAIRKSGF